LATTGTVLRLGEVVVADGLEQINEHDATADTGSEGFGDQPVTVEPASGVGGPDAEHPDGLGDGE